MQDKIKHSYTWKHINKIKQNQKIPLKSKYKEF